MILIQGNESLHESIKNAGLSVTVNQHEAKCVVLVTPTEHLPDGIQAFVLLSGMITYTQWKMFNRKNVITADNIDNLIQLLNIYVQGISRLPDSNNGSGTVNNNPANETVSVPENVPVVEEKLPEPVPKPNPITFDTQERNMLMTPTKSHSLIIASCSTAGGVGKTFWATNLGVYSAIHGINTVIVDFDLGFGDVASALGVIIKGDSKSDAKDDYATVNNWRRYARDLKSHLLKHPSSGVYLLPCIKEDELTEKDAEDLLAVLSELFDTVIIDLGVNPYAPHSKAALNMADMVYLIGGQDVKTIDKVSRFIKQESGNLQITDMRFIVNKVTPTGYFKPREVAKELGFKEYQEIMLDEQGANAAARAKKTVVQMNGSVAGEAVKAIAGTVFTSTTTDNPVKNTKKSLMERLGSIFKRRR